MHNKSSTARPPVGGTHFIISRCSCRVSSCPVSSGALMIATGPPGAGGQGRRGCKEDITAGKGYSLPPPHSISEKRHQKSSEGVGPLVGSGKRCFVLEEPGIQLRGTPEEWVE